MSLGLTKSVAVLIDADSRVTHINHEGCQALGYEAHEVLGRPWLELAVPGRAREEMGERLSRLIAGEVSAVEGKRSPVVTKTGREEDFFWYMARVLSDGGRFVYALGLREDLSELRHSAEELLSLKEFHENVVQSIQEGMFALDRDRRITYWNRAMEEMIGRAAEDVLGREVSEVLPHLAEEGGGELIDAALEGRTVSQRNMPYKARQDRNVYANERYVPLRDKAGAVVGAVVFVEDITELRHVEERLGQLQEEVAQRRTIETAKGILMRELDLSEPECYQLLRRQSQAQRKKLWEVANEVIERMGKPEEKKNST